MTDISNSTYTLYADSIELFTKDTTETIGKNDSTENINFDKHTILYARYIYKFAGETDLHTGITDLALIETLKGYYSDSQTAFSTLIKAPVELSRADILDLIDADILAQKASLKLEKESKNYKEKALKMYQDILNSSAEEAK